MRVEDIERYGQVSLQAVLAGIDQADGDRQIPLLRSAIDLALDRVATAEHAYYDFLAECALLAAQNMQDVRLHDVERRLERLENPENPGIGEILIETAIIFGVELVFTVGVPWLAGPALLMVTSRLIARSSRVGAKIEKRGVLEGLRNAAGSDLFKAYRRFNDPHQPLPLQQLLENVRSAAAKVQSAETALQNAGLEPSKADKIIDAYYGALAGIAGKINSKPLIDFLDGAKGQTLKGRIGESAGQQVAKLLADAVKQPGDSSGTLAESPFLSSTVVGVIQSRLRELRLEAARGHFYTRLLLHQIDDAAFASDAIAQGIARGAFDAIAPLDDALALAEVVRPVVVRGFEALLWHEWLSVTGALLVEPGKTFDAALALVLGELHDGYLPTKLVRQPSIEPGEFGGLGMRGTLVSDSNYVYEGDFYHGVRKLSEQQATYLYDTFAAAYFAVPENARLLPFRNKYDATRYAEMLSLASRNSAEVLSNFERERRLDEMRVMVVIFFTQFIASLRPKASYGVVSDTPILVDDYLSQLPAVKPVDPENAAEPTPEQIANQLNALFGQAGVNARHELELMLATFDGHLTLLEQKQWMYELVHSQLSYEAAEAPDGKTAPDAAREIEALVALIEREYQQLFDFWKANFPESLTDFEKFYEQRRYSLSLPSWSVSEPAPAKPHFPRH